MDERLMLVNLVVPDHAVPVLTDVQFRIEQAVGLDPRFVSLSIWKDEDLPERYVTLVQERVTDPTDRLFENDAVIDMVTEVLNVTNSMPDVHELKVIGHEGKSVGELNIGSFLSMSRRLAEPGHAPDLLAETRDVMENLRLFDGFQGYVFGQSVSVDEEIVAVASWMSREAFQVSVPQTTFYEIRLLTRIA